MPQTQWRGRRTCPSRKTAACIASNLATISHGKGTTYSRAEKGPEKTPALAAEVRGYVESDLRG